MKNTKKNWTIATITTLTVMAGNLCTNYIIAKRNGYKLNKKTMQFEKTCPFGIDLTTEDEIAKSNLAWTIIGGIVGLVVNRTLIEK